MTYGLSTRAFIEHGPCEQLAIVRSSRSTARSWRLLSMDCRLQLIEQALRAANNPGDDLRIAL